MTLLCVSSGESLRVPECADTRGMLMVLCCVNKGGLLRNCGNTGGATDRPFCIDTGGLLINPVCDDTRGVADGPYLCQQ